MQYKKDDTELATELKLAFVWQDEVWDAPETVVGQDGCDRESVSPSIEDLIEIVLSYNDGAPDRTKQTDCRR